MLPLDQPTKTSIIINPHDNTNTQVHDQVHYQISDNSNNNNIILHKNVENDQESNLSIKNNNNTNRQNYRTEEGPRIFRGYDNNNNIIYEEKPNIYNSHHNIKISDNTENNNNQLGQQNFHTNEVQSQPNPLYLQPTNLRREILKKQLTGDIHQISQDSGCPTIHYALGLET